MKFSQWIVESRSVKLTILDFIKRVKTDSHKNNELKLSNRI
jgi:hypothetical protein